jgi:hypothetical protein
MGPLEIVGLEFPGNQLSGEILPALRAVVDKGIIRVVDLAFVKKDGDGTVTALELEDLPGDEAMVFDPVAEDIAGLLSAEDVAGIGAALSPNSSAALLLFEHTWATDVRQAIANAHGRLVLQERIPDAAAEAALAALAAERAGVPVSPAGVETPADTRAGG